MVYTCLFCVLFGWALGFVPWLLPWPKDRQEQTHKEEKR